MALIESTHDVRVRQKNKSDNNDDNRLKRFYTVKDAAGYLGISQAAVYKYVEFGMLSYRRLASIPTKGNPKVKSHGRIIFEVADLDCFIDNFSEKRKAHFNIRNQEKSLDNVN